MSRRYLLILSLLTALYAYPQAITPADISAVISRLTLEQKARLLVGAIGLESDMSHVTPGAAGWTYGIESLGIPSINLADGPVGVRINPTDDGARIYYDDNGLPVAVAGDAGSGEALVTSFCTAFPSTTALAASWDREAAYLQGVAMGDEAKCYGIDVILSPGINIIRNPLCGRNFEYYSEDPRLTGMMAAEVIKGIQSQGIGTSLKHFVANNQQTGKKFNDARISQRALREIYLKGFEICVKDAHPWTVMGSYNKIAGIYTQTNRELLLSLLRDEWGFDGLVLTDWTVRRPTADLLNAHTALIMPGDEEIVQDIIAVVQSGEVSEQTLDACVADVLGVVAKSITAKGWEYTTPDLQAHAALSRRMAAESMVLLKNDGASLPLRKGQKVALFGASAYKSIAGGTGSSNVNKPYVINIDDALADAGYELSPRLREIYGYYDTYMSNLIDAYPDCPDWQKISYHRTVLPEMDLTKNKALVNAEAQDADVAVIVVGRGSGETSDRVVVDDFNLTADEQSMISTVSEAFRKAGKPVVVVLNICGTIEMASWRDKADAILVAWLPGQECGYAVADVLQGAVNPSGRLPMTFPMDYWDMPSSLNYPYVGQTSGRNFDYTNYAEDIWVGYRYFNTGGTEVAYPFGYGLSYTDFAYSKPVIKRRGDQITVSVDITNTGDVPGREVVQLYVKAPTNGSYLKPAAELKTFAKTRTLAPGETQTVSMVMTDYDLASFDEEHSRWLTDAGEYQLYFSLPSADSVPSTTFKINKPREWQVANLLAPVEDFKKIDPTVTVGHEADMDLRVMTFNLHAGADASIDSIAKIINTIKPDFVALEEIDAFTRRGNAPLHNGRNMIADLAAATGMFPLYGRTLDFAGGYYGIGVLSKHPCVSSEVIPLPNPEGYEPRAVVEGTFLVNGKHKVKFASTHLCVEDADTRALQARYIASRYEASDCPVILGGDFNSLPGTEPITLLETVFVNQSGEAPTFPSDAPTKKLDYIFTASPTPVNALTTEVVDLLPWASDHRPVVSTLTIR